MQEACCKGVHYFVTYTTIRPVEVFTMLALQQLWIKSAPFS